VQSLARLKEEHGFSLLIDDAHGTLIMGAGGGGVAESSGLPHVVDVHVGTLSKAFGAQGGFIACTQALKSLIVNAGRTYVYSTALTVPVVAAASAALTVARR
jgi:8-amino-7-oxononanoate synthase